MMKYACKDLGLDCEYNMTGENRVDIMQAAMKHAITEHAEMTINFSMEQSWEYLKSLEAAVRSE